ncbi:MAG: phage holin family protein [Brachymonas sp.]|nr:phage holin family protein [Brachymonas sp.]
MLKLLLKWVLLAVALMGMAYVMPGITVQSFGAAMLAAAVIGLFNALLRPILLILTLPITVLTLGLFLLVINALMFWLAGRVLSGFSVASFWWALGGAVVYSLLGMLIESAVEQKSPVRVERI